MIMTAEAVGIQTEIRTEAEQQLIQAAKTITGMAEAMQRMSQAMEETLERVAELERAVKTLEKVSPQQAAQINQAIRQRAAEICRDWRMPGQELQVTKWIRKAVREMTGVRTAREIPRCDVRTVTAFIGIWEDAELIRKARGRG